MDSCYNILGISLFSNDMGVHDHAYKLLRGDKMNYLLVNSEYPVDIVEKFLQANDVDTSLFDADDEYDDEPIQIGMALTFKFLDGTIACTLILTGYTIMAIYRIVYLAPSLIK